FPAVTGFTAGVQMSGDLKDPKQSIPFGTMASIAIGFVVYIGLAIFIAFKIGATQLANDPNILVSIAWIPQLVIAGIWGATISSALGSILGAPRILQATSADSVTPKFFKKGYGASNEPRRALFFTFLIAEAGILIGELNIIARIVSIFFISTYGLINLSYAIEVWASTDFRPSF
ncbi:MAG: amino acid permease, partial [Chloroflexi bacterium]|nr:amino acid permease [Chloroflexota bacterium]